MSSKSEKNAAKAIKAVRFEAPKNIGAARAATLRSIASMHGVEACGVVREKEFIRLSSIRLNQILGGGLCRGRIYEFYGEFSGGKTALTLDAAANFQRQLPDMFVAFQDVEQSLDMDRAIKLGVNPKKFDIYNPPHAQGAFDQLYKICMSGAYSLGICDSVPALVPVEEMLTETADAQNKMGVFAKMMGTGLRKLVKLAADSKTTIIFINQVRDTMSMYGPKHTTPGGKALKFYSSCRLDIAPVSTKDEDKFFDRTTGDVIGHKIRIKVVKNKLAPPNKTAEMELYYAKAFNVEKELLKIAQEKDIIEYTEDGKYLYKGKQIAKSSKELQQLFREDEKLKMQIMAEVEKIMAPPPTEDVKGEELAEILEDVQEEGEELFDEDKEAPLTDDPLEDV